MVDLLNCLSPSGSTEPSRDIRAASIQEYGVSKKGNKDEAAKQNEPTEGRPEEKKHQEKSEKIMWREKARLKRRHPSFSSQEHHASTGCMSPFS
jgi:hypothetical protein